MKAFIFALSVLLLTLSLTLLCDLYCISVCETVDEAVKTEGFPGAKKALDDFRRHEFLLKLAVDNGYVTEARISLESLISAYECEDEYEISRYKRDIAVRVTRVKKALVI